MDLNKFKGFLLEKRYTYKMCAKVLGLSVASFNQKMNGKSRFYLEELNKLGDELEMTKEEKTKIFLS